MLADLLESISTFTVLPLRTPDLEEKKDELYAAKRQAHILGFLPLAGLIYGFIGAGLIWGLHAETSILVAYLTPIVWFFFSAGQPFASLCRASGALFARSKTAAAELLTRDNFTGMGMAVGLLLLSGEFFALIQGSAVPRAKLGTVVFLVPVISRCSAVVFAVSAWGRNEGTNLGAHRFTAYILAFVVTTLAAAASFEIALLLFVTSLLSGTVLTVILTTRAGSLPPNTLGAIILFNEITCLWVGVLYSLI